MRAFDMWLFYVCNKSITFSFFRASRIAFRGSFLKTTTLIINPIHQGSIADFPIKSDSGKWITSRRFVAYQHTDPTCILFCHPMFFSDDIHSPRCCIFINFWAHRIENVIDWKSIHSCKVISRKYVKNPKENFETDFRL